MDDRSPNVAVRVASALLAFACGTPAAFAALDDPGTPRAFSTRLGSFAAEDWSAVPGWSDESHGEALAVFVSTCRALRRRPAWREPCDAARLAARAGDRAAREFFEREFVAYRVTERDADDSGLMTGYFEPTLRGSLARRAPFVHPVYATPPDLLYLDTRRLPREPAARPGWALVDGRDVVPVDDPAAARARGERVYAIDASEAAEPLDRRLRLRVDGDRVVPYWTREQIEAASAPIAPAIAWVEDPDALYVMQVQGSGSIRLTDGRTLRLAYADQNGHPFSPGGPSSSVRTRSLRVVEDREAAVLAANLSPALLALVQAPAEPSAAPATGTPRASGAPSSARPGRVSADTGQAVDRLVEMLLQQARRAPAGASTGVRPPQGAGPSGAARDDAARPDGARPDAESSESDVRRDAVIAKTSLARYTIARRNDRSYVFFRESDNDDGPVGALGVTLEPRRSVAVDPRATPLGAPVFIDARSETGEREIRRLMFAHDTGGAIRGAVRADFFWGSGPSAGARALRTRDTLAMWVLLPRGFDSMRRLGVRTRGLGPDTLPYCVIDDAQFC